MLGDPEVLFQDLLRNPERYEEGTDQVLQQMLNGTLLAELSTEEQDLLNRATFEFAQAPPCKPPEIIKEADAKTKRPRPKKDPWEL